MDNKTVVAMMENLVLGEVKRKYRIKRPKLYISSNEIIR